MQAYCSSERNIQILIMLLKLHNIRKIVISPGATNVSFVAPLQKDSWFEVYSSADERSAAYIACGMAEESGEPVVLSCTGATASRNYIPALTEAFYRKLPILAVTSAQPAGRIGHNIPQCVDRTAQLNDIVNLSVQIPIIKDSEDEWAYSVKLNEAILSLRAQGGGPVHINLTTSYGADFSMRNLPPVQVIERIEENDELPKITAASVGIFVGSHTQWSPELTAAVDTFCGIYNGAVLCDHTSNYCGRYEVHPNLVLDQDQYISPRRNPELLIHIGNVSGAYMSLMPKEVWRINPDGVARDTFRKLRYVFEMNELNFFSRYVEASGQKQPSSQLPAVSYYNEWKAEYDRIRGKVPELPFSNVWIAQNTADKLPEKSVLHLGILNSLRSWNFFELPKSVRGYSSTGGFGIDGCVSTLIGASLAAPKRLFFGVVGDLAFFYDMNSIANRHVGNNLRLMVVNNGRGTEFKNYFHHAARLGVDVDPFIAAAGHYGRKSPDLLRHYAADLGFEYMSASNKEEYLASLNRFTSPNALPNPILFEVFTDSQDESDALFAIKNIEISLKGAAKKQAKKFLREALGTKQVERIKRLISK